MSLLRIPEAAVRLGARLKTFLAAHGKGMLAALLVAAATLWLHGVMKDDEGVMIYRLVEGESQNLTSRMTRGLRDRATALRDLARRWEAREPSRSEWEADADSLIRTELQFRAVEWVEPSLAVRWIRPWGVRLPGAALDSIHDELRLDELHALLSGGEGVISRSFPLPGAPRQLLMCAPIHNGDRVTGYLVGVARANDLIDAMARESVERGYSVSVNESSLHVYGPVWLEGGEESSFGNDSRVSVSDLAWDVTVWPSPEELHRLRSAAPRWALALGLALALLLGYTLDRLEAWRRRALAVPGESTREAGADHAEEGRLESRAGDPGAGGIAAPAPPGA